MNLIDTRRCLALLACVVSGAIAAPGGAATLDWDTNPWPSPFVLTETYTNIGGGDIIVTISDPLNVLVSGQSPDTNNILDPTGNNGEDNLYLRASGNDTSPWVTVTFTFTHALGVTDLFFSAYDVDASPTGQVWADTLDVIGLTAGPSVVPTSVTAVTGSPSWTWTPGTSLIYGQQPDQPATGPGSDNGTAQITFATPITGLQIVYRNDEVGGGSQTLGISDITFTPIPEPSPLALLATGLVALALWRSRV